jgi:DNA adenine methylase
MERVLMAAGGEQGQNLLSPLRYPGGKRKLAGYIAAAIRLNSLRPRLFVEPFAGGASVSLYLLEQGLVDKIALGEKDELIAAFWHTVFFDHNWLVEQLRGIQPTLELWTEFRHWDPQSNREKALKCLFLNRTSFSGILNRTAGPLGGQKQASEYRVDCRFYPETVIRRIQTLAGLAGRVQFIHCGDWRETMRFTAEAVIRKQTGCTGTGLRAAIIRDCTTKSQIWMDSIYSVMMLHRRLSRCIVTTARKHAQ